MPLSSARSSAQRTRVLLNIYVGAVLLTALVLAVPAILNGEIVDLGARALKGFLFWLLLSIAADLVSITLPRGEANLSVGGAIDFGIVLLFPIGLAAVAGFTSALVSSLVRRVELRKLIFNPSMICLTMK